MNDKTMEEFEAWADEKGFCLDQIFMSTDGVPDNPYENEDTKLAYAIWCASRSPSCSNVPTELDVAEDKIREMETLITVLRDDIRELYSMRGEDELTAKYCNAILTATADI